MITNNQTKALYTINKAAKQIRDKRREFSKRIKPFSKGETGALSEEDAKVLGVASISYHIGLADFESFQELYNYLKEYPHDDQQLRENIETFANLTPEDEERCYDDFGECLITSTTSRNELEQIGISADGVEKIVQLLEEYDEESRDIEYAHKLYHRVKDYYENHKTELKKMEDPLYVLKACVLIASGFEPVEYHIIKATKEPAAYYQIYDYKFHRFVKNDDVDTEVLRDEPISEAISAVNRLENPPAVEDAVSVLLAYLGVDSSLTSELLAGKTDVLPRKLVEQVIMPTYKNNNDDYVDDWEDYYEWDENEYDEW